MSDVHIRATIESVKLGRVLQEEHPEIRDFYIKGNTQRRIVGIIGIIKKYDVSPSIAKGGVQRALAGYQGGLGEDSYDGLVSKIERENINEDHRRTGRLKAGKISGKISKRERKGIHRLTFEERSRNSKKSGKKVYLDKKGIHGMSKEKTTKASLGGVKARGEIPWTRVGDLMPDGSVCEVSEDEFAYQRSLEQEYRRGTLINNIKIAEELKRKYHTERTRHAVRSAIYLFRKTLEDL